MRGVALAAVGRAPEAVLEQIHAALESAFGLPVLRLTPVEEPSEGAYSPSRGQWHSQEFLKALRARLPAGAARLLGITERDLFVPVLSFVYGQAQLGGELAVVSLARLRQEFHGLPPDPVSLERRAATEAVHELGHTFGLVHCPDPRCPMSLSLELLDLDRKAGAPCPRCSALLADSGKLRACRASLEGDTP